MKDGINVRQHLVPQMRALMADSVRAVGQRLNPRNLEHCFEVYGFDFMVDANRHVWLIECNANPCLDLCSAYLSHLIPTMLDHALVLTLDRIFPSGTPHVDFGHGGEGGTKWDLIFDSSWSSSAPPACTWAETLPADFGGSTNNPVTMETLGRQILCSGTKKRGSLRRKKDKEAAQEEGADADEPEACTT
eukprot:gnl/TRDRNA2_/TRDRNA2_167320_c0_seq3.p1 gnl/TRDRNA2_/TRDRNA2_167320_c0~~gnl/TRDRNA2_/TRDRNA2_167320_c0_seq3.p1  ORF type:complete len:190 (+),score=33.59 gnl/TRDRNA2_/TRDRNA2_167320_c0_seq3:27-596(+)